MQHYQPPNDVTAFTSALLLESLFQDPFDDPRLEPLPLRADHGNELQHKEENAVVASLLEPLPMRANHRRETQELPSDPNMSLRILSTRIQMLDPRQGVTQISSSQANCSTPCADVDETVARFRPFQDDKWKNSFQRLVQFKLKFGHCCVPHSYEQDPTLARWVKRQRHQFKKYRENDPTSTMTTSRFDSLEALGFVWNSHNAAWMERLNEIVNFKSSKGHCNVPSSYPENTALSTWVKSQRRQYKLFVSGAPSTMTIERLQELQNLGFVFEPSLLQRSCK